MKFLTHYIFLQQITVLTNVIAKVKLFFLTPDNKRKFRKLNGAATEFFLIIISLRFLYSTTNKTILQSVIHKWAVKQMYFNFVYKQFIRF